MDKIIIETYSTTRYWNKKNLDLRRTSGPALCAEAPSYLYRDYN